MAGRIAEYAFLVARQLETWDIGYAVIPMPRFLLIYVKRTDKTPKTRAIRFTFPDGQSVDYKSANMILEVLESQALGIVQAFGFGNYTRKFILK